MQYTDITEGGNTMNALYGSTTEVGAVQRIFTVAATITGGKHRSDCGHQMLNAEGT
jgi:hypothetical protein